jgi:hypothetical protein
MGSPMGKLVIKLDGKELFAWSGERHEIRDLNRRVERAAKSVNKTVAELTGLTMQSALSPAGLSLDPSIRDMQIGGIVHYLLRMPIGQAEQPGTHGDRVAAGSSFVFDLRREPAGGVRIEVTAQPAVKAEG